ncbi:MAG TPA: hypothetical protein VFS21_31040 [Roseiflexaceae bacterium]|nr:hypothetical protein [Roseiflexaceae bacterium]
MIDQKSFNERVKTNKKLFRFPLNLRISRLFFNNIILRYIRTVFLFLLFISFLFAIALAFTWSYTNFLTTVVPIFRNTEFIGLFGALFGAFIGSVVGGMMSFLAQSTQARANSMSQKNNTIYRPLYNNFRSFLESIDDHKHFFSVCFDENQRGQGDILLTEWHKIKSDARYLQTPRWLIHILDGYFYNFKFYFEIRLQATNEARTKANDIFTKHSIKTDFISGFLDRTLYFVSNKNVEDMLNILKNEAPPAYRVGVIADENIDKLRSICIEIVQSVENIDSYKRFNQFYTEEIRNRTAWLEKELADTIKYIEVRYSNQNDEL